MPCLFPCRRGFFFEQRGRPSLSHVEILLIKNKRGNFEVIEANVCKHAYINSSRRISAIREISAKGVCLRYDNPSS